MAKLGYVYALVDPRYDEVRYIGVSRDPWKRAYLPYIDGRPWQSHVAQAVPGGTSHKDYWIDGIVASDAVPAQVILEFGDWTNAEMAGREIDWITYYRSIGANLLNQSGGGEQTPLWQMSDETRALISKRTREAMANPEVRARIAKGAKGRIPWNRSPDWTPHVRLSDEERMKVQAEAGRRGSREYWGNLTNEQRREHGGKISVKKQQDWDRISEDERKNRGLKMALGKRRAKAERIGWVLNLL